MLFLLISVFLFITLTIIVPKKISRSELYAVALFSIVLGFCTDVTLDLKYHLYGYFQPGVQFAGFMPILILFPTGGMVYANFFPYKRKLIAKIIYIIFSTTLCLIYEYLSITFGFFYHNGWNYWYSAIVYPILFWMLLVHIWFYRRYIQR